MPRLSEIPFIVFCLVFSTWIGDVLAQAPGRRVLPNHVPSMAARTTSVGRMAQSKRLHLAIGLPLRNSTALAALIDQIYDPRSPQFHQYLTVEQFTAQFGPVEADYERVKRFAETNGLTVQRTYRNRLLLDVAGSVGDIEKAFQVTVRLYQHPRESRVFFAPDTAASVPVDVPVLEVSGLDDFLSPQPLGLHAAPFTGTAQPFIGSFYGLYTSGDFRAAYAPGTALNGAGQSVGILAFDGYYTNDITTYESYCGLSNVVVTNVLLNGFSGAPGSGNTEVALDIEMAIGMAPGVARVIVYEGTSGDSIVNQMAADNIAKQLSSSWSFPLYGNADQELQELLAQGQVMFQSSGDSGNWGFGLAPMPIDNPNMVVVGGTTLSTTVAGGDWLAEDAWQLSGGCPTDYGIPSWQTNLDMTLSHGSTSRRNIPDVAMISSGVLAIGDNGRIYAMGGTSVSAPLWAGFTALINQQEAINADPPVGFLNPLIYPLGLSTNYNACFHDITTGNNTNANNPTDYFAVAGYDLCTGWGTPKGTNLINFLAPFYPLRVTPVGGLGASGIAGRTFAPSAQTFSISNATGFPFSWAVENCPAWLNVSPAGGSLASVSAITVSPNAVAEYLPMGTYTANLAFRELKTGLAQTRAFTLTVNPLVGNGGFESGGFASWTASGALNQSTVVSGDPSFVHGGGWGARLSNSGLPPGTITQTVPTTSGGVYQLSFWLDSSANPRAPHKTTPNQFLVSWNGTTLFNQTNIGIIGWTNLQFIVTASGASSTLQFGFRDDSWALGLDDITLQPIVAPVYQGVSKMGTNLSFNWAAVAGFKYQMQYRTNLSKGSWTTIGSPVLATNYLSSSVNPVPADPERFYRLIWVP